MEQELRKFWLVLVLGLTTTVFFSCKNDDNKLENGNNPFVGSWVYSEKDDDETGTITFNADKTLHWLSNDEGDILLLSGTYSYSEKDKTLAMVLTNGTNTVTVTFNYVFMGKDLVLTGKDSNNKDYFQVFTRQ